MAAEHGKRQCSADGAQAKTGAGLEKEDHAHGLCGLTKDRFLRRQAAACVLKTLARGGAERAAESQAEEACDIDQRLERARFQAKGIGAFARFFDHQIAEKSKRRKVRQAVMRKNAQERGRRGKFAAYVTFDIGENICRALNYPQIEK